MRKQVEQQDEYIQELEARLNEELASSPPPPPQNGFPQPELKDSQVLRRLKYILQEFNHISTTTMISFAFCKILCHHKSLPSSKSMPQKE